MNICINLIPPESRVIGLHVTVWVYLLLIFFVAGSKKRMFSAIECISAVQGHPRSSILAPVEKVYALPISD